MINLRARLSKLCWLAALGLSLLSNQASLTPTAPIQKNTAISGSAVASWYVPNQGYQLKTVKVHKNSPNLYGITMEFCPKTGACTTPVSHCYGNCSSGTTYSLSIPKIVTSVYFCCANTWGGIEQITFTLEDGSTVRTSGLYNVGCNSSCSNSCSILGNLVGFSLTPKKSFLGTRFFAQGSNSVSCWDDYECSYLKSGGQGTPIDTFGKCSFTASKSIKYATNISTFCFTAAATVISFKKDGVAVSQPSWISHNLSALTFTFTKPIDTDFGASFDVFINANSHAASFTIANVDDCFNPCLAVTFLIDPSIIPATTTYNLADPKLSFPALDQTKIIPSEIFASCPILQLDIETSENVAIDSTLFTFGSNVLDVCTTDSTKINSYNMVLKVKYSGLQYSYQGSLPFIVIVTEPCLAVTFSIDQSIIAATTKYYLADPKLIFPALDKAKIIPSVTLTSCPVLQLDVETSENIAIDLTVFTFASDVLDVYTTDSAKINTYTMVLKVKYLGVQYSYQGSLPFTVIVTEPCLEVTFTIDQSIIAAMTTYYLGDPKLIFPVLDQSKIIPNILASCPALQFDLETSENVAINSTVFTFVSDILDVYTTESTNINTYNMVLKVKYSGVQYSQQGSLPFTVNVADQVCASATLSPLPNPQLSPYKYTEDPFSYNLALLFRVDPAQCPVSYSCVSIMHQSSTELNCNSTQVQLKNSNTLFEFTSKDLTIVPGNYTVTYRGQIGKAISENTFVFQLVNPCPEIALVFFPNSFPNQTYLIGSSQKEYQLFASVVAKYKSNIDCGPLIITDFWTKDGNALKDLDMKIFKFDKSSQTFKIESDDISMVGTYEVFYEVALKNYQTNKKSSKLPITIIVEKQNTAPRLPGLSSKQESFDIVLQNENPGYVFVGKPVDGEGDQVTLTFDNHGENSISFDQDSEEIKIESKIQPDSYIVSFKLKDNNKDSLTTHYQVTLNVTLAIPEALNITNSTFTNASDTSQKPENVTYAQIYQDPSKPDPEIKLKSFSQTGVLHFVFNQPFIVPRNLTFIDSSVLNITIDILPENDKQCFNFTWNVTKYTEKYMDVQLIFKEAYYVQVDHFINVQVLQKDFFVSREKIRAIRDLRPILDSNLQMRIRCMPQIQLSGSAAAIIAGLNNAIKSTKAIIASKFMFNLSLNTALGLLWGMINGLQILSIMPLVDCEMPGNAQFFFVQIYTIASFNVIDVSSVTSRISNTLHLKKNLNSISARMQGFGFNTTSQIDNLGIVFIFFMLVGAYLIMLAFSSCLTRVRCKRVFRGVRDCKCKGWIQNQLQKAMARLFWNFFIRLFIETYLDNAIANALKLKALMWHPWTECLSSLFAILIVAALVIYPIASWIMMFKFKTHLNDEEVENRFGAAYEEIRTSSNTALGYPSIFMIKRLVFTIFIFLVEDKRILQHFLIINMLACSTAYTWESEPFTDNLSNFQEVYNDYMVSIVSYSLLVFSDFVPNKKAQYQIGWVVCVLIGVQVSTNIGIIIFGLIKTLLNRLKLKKIKKQREQDRIAKEKERLEIREALELLESLNAPRAQFVDAKPKSQFINHFVQPLSRLRQKNRREQIGNLSNLPLERVSEEESIKGSVNADLQSLPDLNDELRIVNLKKVKAISSK